MRTLFLGLLTGLFASALRAPLGFELVHVTATPASVAVAYRAVAFLLLAVALFAGRGRAGENFTPVLFLAGSFLGLTAHGLFSGATPESHLGAVLFAAIMGAALWYVARAPLGAEIEEDDSEAPKTTPTAHALIGAGLALSLEGIYRHLRLLGAGTSSDDSVFACVLVALVLAGAACFKSIVRSTTAKTLCLAGGALGCFVSLRLLRGLSNRSGLDPYLRWFDLDTSLHGTLIYDALLAGVILVVPAFLLGAGFQGLQRRSNLAGLGAGVAIGLLISPHFLTPIILNKTGGNPFVSHELPASHLIPWGAAVAFAGAALHLVRHPAAARWAALSFFFVIPLPFILSPNAVLILSPWQRRDPAPELILDTPEGLLTVETTEGEIDTVTLDRRLISPAGPLGVAIDGLQLRAAVGLLPREVRERRDFRVLLLGQLTPERASVLTSLGAGSIDRTASWHEVMPYLEHNLFHETSLPKGAPRPPSEARSKIMSGSYDLVIAPSIQGEQPTTRNFASGPNTITVVWFDAAGGIAHEALGTHVLLSTATLSDLSIGVVHGLDKEQLPEWELMIDAGPRLEDDSPWKRLGMRIQKRERRARAAMARRLGEAESEGEPFTLKDLEEMTEAEKAELEVGALLAKGIDAHFQMQKHSSPYEKPEQKIELSDDALTAWSAAGRNLPLTRPTYEILGAAARTLKGKRFITRIYKHLQSVSEVHPSWTELVFVLAYADLETLEPSDCIHRIESTFGLGFETWRLHVLISDALVQLGRAADGVEHLWTAYEALPTHHGIRERLAIALVRAGRPEGKAMIENLLFEDPSREHLEPYKEVGPLPAAPSGFTPLGPFEDPSGSHDDHGH